MVIQITARALIAAEFPHVMKMTGELFENGEKREGRTEVRALDAMVVVLFQMRPLNRNEPSKKIYPANCRLRRT